MSTHQQATMSFRHLLALSDDNASRDSSPFGARMLDASVRGLRSPGHRREGGWLGLCTESLGSESSSDDSAGEGEDIYDFHDSPASTESDVGSRDLVGGRCKRELPPPLPSLAHRGFMKAERRDGRLVLTRVTVESPPAVFRAYRSDGRLQLQLAEHTDDDELSVLVETARGELELSDEEEEEEEEHIDHSDHYVMEEDIDHSDHYVIGEEEESREVAAAMIPAAWQQWEVRRCHEMPTAGASINNPAARFSLFWNNPRFMTTA